MLKEKGEDRRMQKTRNALHEAFIAIMFEKSFDAILIQEILDRANVGRSTFYTHFKDKNDLLLKSLQGLQEFLRNAQLATPTSSGKKHERVIGFSLAMFEHVYEHKKIHRSLRGGGWIIVSQRIEQILVQLIKEEARPLFKHRASSGMPFELFAHILGTTFMSVLTWWQHSNWSLPPTEINVLFREMVIPMLDAHLS